MFRVTFEAEVKCINNSQCFRKSKSEEILIGGCVRGRRRTTSETEAIQIKGPQREEKGGNKESGC